MREQGELRFRGSKFELEYTLYSIIKLEELGVDIFNYFDTNQLTVEMLTQLIYIGLISEYPDESVTEVVETFSENDLGKLCKQVFKALGSNKNN